jgi:hypothetical protein
MKIWNPITLVFGYSVIDSGARSVDGCQEPRWQKVRNMLATEEKPPSLEQLQSISSYLFQDLDFAFSCASGALAVTTYLGDFYHTKGDHVRAVRFRQVSSIFGAFALQSGGKEGLDTSGWGVTWKDTIDRALESMRAHVNSDSQRDRSMADMLRGQNRVTSAKLKIGLVTICDYDSTTTPLTKLSKSNKRSYASKHNIDLIFHESAPVYTDHFSDIGGMSTKIPHAWRKIDALLSAMGDNKANHDWLMWMDCDSFFMDDEIILRDVVSSIGEVIHLDKERKKETTAAIARLRAWKPSPGTSFRDSVLQFSQLSRESYEPDSQADSIQLIASEDGLMLNTGVFFIKKSVFMFHFLWRVRAMLFNSSAITNHPWWEQTGMVMLLMAPHVSDDASWGRVKSNGGMPPFVRLYSQKQINGYPPLIAGMLSSHAEFENGDFIVSFSGCKTYTSQQVCNNVMLNYFEQSCRTNDCSNVIQSLPN